MPLVNDQFTDLIIPKKHERVLCDRSRNWRYRVIYGGRNGGKDWTVTGLIIERAIRENIRVLFTREHIKNIAASWHQLLKDQIDRLGYSEYFTLYRDKIESNTGSVFRFDGLNDISSGDVKSTEGLDLAVIGEAENLTQQSFNDLKRTVRKPGSEIWIIFNTKYEDDFVYDYFITETPENCITGFVNGFALACDGETVIRADNPFVSDESLAEAQHDFYYDRSEFDNQCLGLTKGGGGRVYSQYKRDVHFIEFDYRMLSECDLYMSIDPHYKYYPAIGWHAVTPTDCVVTYNEWPKFEDLGMWYDLARDKITFNMSMEELANVILAEDMTLQYGGRIISRTGDPRFFSSEPSFKAELQKHGVGNWIDSPFETIATQRNNIKSLMNYNTKIPLIGHNRPTWYVSDKCRNINRAYLHHQWNEKKDAEKEDHKDFIDQDRYFMASIFGKPRFKERIQERYASVPILPPHSHNISDITKRHLM